MDLSVIAFLGLLLAVAALRLAELRISKRHQREMAARGAAKVEEPKFAGWCCCTPRCCLALRSK